MPKKILFAAVSLVFAATPLIAGAETANVASLQAQISSLNGQLEALQAKANASGSGSASATTASPMMPACPAILRTLTVGARGDDVTQLQQLLSAQGYLNVSATGYFGALTKAAVGKWQVENSITTSGSAGFGVFGPLSRAHISRGCGGGITRGFSANPQWGTVPLSVQFTSTAPQGGTIGSSVNFGDGTSGNLGFAPVCASCNALATVSHTYTATGTYTATLLDPSGATLGSTTIVVGSPISTSNIQRITAPGSVTLSTGGIAEVRNENVYFALTNLTSTSATIQTTGVGCWNSFPSDPPPQVRCMIAIMPIAPQTLTVGQTYSTPNYAITLTQISNSTATFSVSLASAMY